MEQVWTMHRCRKSHLIGGKEFLLSFGPGVEWRRSNTAIFNVLGLLGEGRVGWPFVLGNYKPSREW